MKLLNFFKSFFSKNDSNSIVIYFQDFYHFQVHTNHYYYAVDYKNEHCVTVTINVNHGKLDSSYENIPKYFIQSGVIGHIKDAELITKNEFVKIYSDALEYLSSIQIKQLK